MVKWRAGRVQLITPLNLSSAKQGTRSRKFSPHTNNSQWLTSAQCSPLLRLTSVRAGSRYLPIPIHVCPLIQGEHLRWRAGHSRQLKSVVQLSLGERVTTIHVDFIKSLLNDAVTKQ